MIMDQRVFFVLFLGVVLIQIQSSFSLPLSNSTSTSLEQQPAVNQTQNHTQSQGKKARQDDFLNSTTLQLEKEHEEKVKAMQSVNLVKGSDASENATLNITTSTPATTISPLNITNTTKNTTTTTTTETPFENQVLSVNDTIENVTNPDNTTSIVETIELIEEIPISGPIEIERTSLQRGHENDHDKDKDNDNDNDKDSDSERETFQSIFRDFDDMKDVKHYNLDFDPVDSIEFAPDEMGDNGSVEVKSEIESVAFFYPKSKF